MSSMTKFLKQKCSFESATRDSSGIVTLNEYGDIQYNSAIQLSCRHEKFARDVQVTDGSIVRSESRYFLDDSVEIQTDDRLDGHIVISCSEYIDQFGACIGYEAYVR